MAPATERRKVRAMFSAIKKHRDKRSEGDEGFTLIELLVVIIIIGILAAIAIPVFLNQRQKGWDAAVQSDLRNAATAQETYFTGASSYTATVADLTATDIGLKFSGDDNYATDAATSFAIDSGNATGYCMSGVSKSGTTWYLGSDGTIADNQTEGC